MNSISPLNYVNELVHLYILSCDRRDFCREAIASAVNQNYKNCEIIVSDNSMNDDVSAMVLAEFPMVKLIRRQPSMPALDHFNLLIEECHSPLVVFFHDDDVLEPNHTSRLVSLLASNQNMAGAASNAFVIRGAKKTRQMLMGDFKGIVTLNKPIDLIQFYLSLELNDPAPFPGYMYRTKCIKGLALDFDQGGKHADVSFLCKVLERAPIVWTSECLFNYRIHFNNDSRIESIGERLSLLRYVQKTTGLDKKSKLIIDFKFLYLRRWLLQNSIPLFKSDTANINNHSRKMVVQRFLITQGLRMIFTRVDFWRRVWRLLLRNHL
jgi:glycosyltransferase involved in cell wall biosynthesis